MKTILLLSACVLAAPLFAAPPRVAVGYLAEYSQLAIEDVPWKDLTHLCHAYLQLDGLGKPVASEEIPDTKLAEAAHGRGVKVLLTVGAGATTLGLEKASESEAGAAACAKKIVELATRGGYDGVDLAWESPRNAATRDGFTRILAALRQELDAASDGRDDPLLLTAQVSPAPFFAKWIDGPSVAPLVDWLGVMAYDMCGPFDRTTAHHAPLFPSPNDPERSWRSVSGALARWQEDKGVPKEKLVMGLPMFGRAYPVAKSYQPLNPELRNRHGVMTFARIGALVGAGWPAEWDDPCKAPWISSPDKDDLAVIAYDDRNSIHLKVAWARENGYRGYYFWALGQDRMPDGSHWLVRAATKAWPADETPEPPTPPAPSQ